MMIKFSVFLSDLIFFYKIIILVAFMLKNSPEIIEICITLYYNDDKYITLSDKITLRSQSYKSVAFVSVTSIHQDINK